MFFNTVLPTLIGGDAVRIAYLYGETGKLERAAAASLTERVLGVAALIAIAVAALLFSPRQALTAAVVSCVLVVTAGFLVGIFLLFSPWAYRVAAKCMRAMRMGKLVGIIEELQNAVAAYRRNYRVLAVALLLAFGVQFVVIAVYALLAYGMGLRVSVCFFLMAVPVTVLASMAPVTISGLGVRELTWVFLLGEQGVPQAEAIALSLMWFAVVTVASMFGGPAFLLWRRPPQPQESPTPDPHTMGRRQ